jgi:hypothetical protein
MFTPFRIMPLTILALFLLTMTLVSMFSSLVTVKLRKARQEELSLNVPHSEVDFTAPYY